MSKKRKLRTLEDVLRRYKDQNPIIIDGWDHLKHWYSEHGPSKTHEIIFSEHSAMIEPLSKNDHYEGFHYLSTHTFYGMGSWLHSTQALNRAGFKGIIIRNWDAKEEGQIWPDKTWTN